MVNRLVMALQTPVYEIPTEEVTVILQLTGYPMKFIEHLFFVRTGLFEEQEEWLPTGEIYGYYHMDYDNETLTISKSIEKEMVDLLKSKCSWFCADMSTPDVMYVPDHPDLIAYRKNPNGKATEIK